jgi:hypothetical protein
MEETKKIERYIGPNKVMTIANSDRKTYLGNKVVKIQYENKTEEEMPEKVFETAWTPEKSDLTQLRTKIINPIIEKFMALILDSEIRLVDVEYLFGTATALINQHLENANTLLWKKEPYERTLVDVHEVLTKNGKQPKKSGVDKSGKQERTQSPDINKN